MSTNTMSFGNIAELKQWLLSPAGAVAFGIFATFVAYIDSTHSIWSPYIIVYATLSLIVPLWLGVVKWRATKLQGRELWLLTFIVTCIAIFFDSGVWTLGYNWLLSEIGLMDEKHSIVLATVAFINAAASGLNITHAFAENSFVFFIIIWAPVGEELLYRSYIYDSVKSRYGIAIGFIVSTFFFSVRHTLHFMYMWPGFSFAGVAWAVAMVFFSACATYLYERAGGIFVVMVMHFALNVVGSIVGSL